MPIERLDGPRRTETGPQLVSSATLQEGGTETGPQLDGNGSAASFVRNAAGRRGTETGPQLVSSATLQEGERRWDTLSRRPATIANLSSREAKVAGSFSVCCDVIAVARKKAS